MPEIGELYELIRRHDSSKNFKTLEDQIELLMKEFDVQLKVQTEKLSTKKEDVNNASRFPSLEESPILDEMMMIATEMKSAIKESFR